MHDKPLILMVEDEPDVLRINARILTRRGYEVLCAETFNAAQQVLQQQTPDLLILDIMLPDGSGYDLCDAFRRKNDHPVIFLTGKTEVSDKIDGLNRGGDYYITKPYDPDELLAAVNRLLQRHTAIQKKQSELTTIVKGTLSLNIPKAKAEVSGTDTGLTAKEFALLLHLVQHEGEALSPEYLYETVWGKAAENDTRTVRFHIANLRKKLNADNAVDFDIISVYGKGYSFTTLQ